MNTCDELDKKIAALKIEETEKVSIFDEMAEAEQEALEEEARQKRIQNMEQNNQGLKYMGSETIEFHRYQNYQSPSPHQAMIKNKDTTKKEIVSNEQHKEPEQQEAPTITTLIL